MQKFNLNPRILSDKLRLEHEHTVEVSFIHDFRLDDFFYDIFQRHNPDNFIKWITVSFIINPLHNGQMEGSCQAVVTIIIKSYLEGNIFKSKLHTFLELFQQFI